MVPTAAQPSSPAPPSAMTPREIASTIAPGPVVTPTKQTERDSAARDDANQRGSDTYERQTSDAALAVTAASTDVESFDQQQSVQRSIRYLRDVIDPDLPDGFASNAERAAAENTKRLIQGEPPPPGTNVDLTA
ncbi:MAG TPA: hypothetical protein VK157_00525 [Phycisphaerales bacterium]|nr:hypothetical protein [Phycisphaerales bacterium]